MYDHLGLTQGYAHDLMRGSSAAGPAAHFGMPHSDALGMSSAGKQNGSPGFESALQDAATDARARISQTLQELAGLGSSLEGPFGFMISVVLPGLSRSCTADGSVEHHEGGIARVHHEQDPALGPTEVVRAQAENILRYHAQEWASRQEPPVRLPNISVDGTDVERMHEGPLGDAGMMQHMMGVPPGLEGSDHLQCRDIPAGARDAAMIPAMGMGAGGVGGGMDPGMAAWSGPMDPGFLHGQGSVLMGIGYGVGMTPKGMDNSGLAKQHKNVPRNTARKIIRDVMDKFVKGEERLVLCKALQCGRNMECHCQPIRERLHLPNGVPCSKAIGTVALPKDAYVKIITWAKDYFPDIYRLHVTPSIEIWLEKELRQGPLRPFDAMQLSLYHESTAVDRGPPNGHGVDARDIAGMCFGAQVQDMGVAPGGMPNGIPPAFHGHAQVPVGVYPEIGQPPPANAAVGRSEAMVMHNRGGVAMSEAMAMHGDSGGAVMSEAMVMHGDKGAVGQYMLTSLARIAEMAQPSRLSDAGGGFAGTHGGGHQVDGSGDGHGGRHGVDESRDGHVGGVGDDGASNGRPAKRSRTDVEGGLEGVFDG